MSVGTGTLVGSPDPDPDGEQFSQLSRRRRGVRVTSAAVVALGLAVAGGTAAGAATTGTPVNKPSGTTGAGPFARPPGGGPPAAVGTVKSVSDNSFTVTISDGKTVTVDVSSSTTYLDPKASSPSLANVTVGEHVAVFGTDASNVITAKAVAIGVPPSGPPMRAFDGKSPGSLPPPSGAAPPSW